MGDADMQKFRPEPNPNPIEDPWYASRLPDQTMQSHDRLAAPAATYGYPELPLSGPYGCMYPQDQLSQIKMRNRRFMNACAQEMWMGNMGMGAPGMMMQPQPQMMFGPPTLDYELAQDELSVLDQELNMTRRANRPFVPQHHQGHFSRAIAIAQTHRQIVHFRNCHTGFKPPSSQHCRSNCHSILRARPELGKSFQIRINAKYYPLTRTTTTKERLLHENHHHDSIPLRIQTGFKNYPPSQKRKEIRIICTTTYVNTGKSYIKT